MENFLKNLNLYFPYNTINLLDILQIIILFGVFYWLLKSLKKTRAWIITKGMLIVFGLYLIMKFCGLNTIAYLFEMISGLLSIAIIIMFQPDLRKILERIGKKDFLKSFSFYKKKSNNETWFNEKTITEITKAANEMSNVKTGALIVLERAIPLEEWETTGIYINSDISWQLFLNIFEKNTPLHDGAIIVSNDKIKAATCYLPLSESNSIDKSLGTRHRAGIGITECTDAIVVSVSEETGEISYIENGQIQHGITQGKLSELLYFSRTKVEKLDKNKNSKKKNAFFNKNMTLKIFAMFVAVLTWFLTINTNDEMIEYTFENIPITTQNENTLQETGYSYNFDGQNNVNVTILARRSIVEQIKQEDIVAIANFNKLSITNSIPVDIEISKKYQDYVEIKEQSLDTIVLTLENTETIEIPVEFVIKGMEEEGYFSIVDKTNQQTIKVTGPHSIISILDKAIATIDVSNKNSDFTTNIPFTIYDRNGSKINLNKLTVDKNKVEVFVNVYEITYLPIEVVAPDCPENMQCELLYYETSINEVPVVGEEEILNELTSVQIQIGLEETLTTNWAYKLPSGVYPATKDTTISIQSEVETYEYTSFSIPTKDLKIKGLKNNQMIEFNFLNYNFFAFVETSIKNNIDATKLEPTIDLTTLNNDVAIVTFRDTDGVRFIEEQTIEVKVKNKGKIK